MVTSGSHLLVLGCLICGAMLDQAQALNIRVKESSVVGQFRRVWQPYAEATMNPGFSPAAELFTGIGWPGHPTEWYRHYGLVSPRHIVGAAHYLPELNWPIRFLGKNGELHDYELESISVVKNADRVATDLFLGTLKQPVDLDQIDPFPIYNLPNLSDYVGKSMVVFGKAAEGLQTTIDGHWMLENEPGFDTTRFLYFDYDPAGSAPSDVHYEGGDSGTPAFVMTSGKPALVGNASSLDTIAGGVLRSSLSLVPYYAPQIDALMEPTGYHLVRAVSPAGLSLAIAHAAEGALVNGKPGAMALTLSAPAGEALHNLRLEVGGQTPPDQLTGNGWISEKNEDGSWSCRRAGLGAGESSVVHAVWNFMPPTADLEVTRAADGVPEITSSPAISVGEPGAGTHDESSSSLDGDGDGVSDELEFALGGDPAVASLSNATGGPLLPRLEELPDGVRFSFTRRSPSFSASRCYLIDFQADGAGWSGNLPVGSRLEARSFDPAWPGFEQVRLRVPFDSSSALLRLRYESAD